MRIGGFFRFERRQRDGKACSSPFTAAEHDHRSAMQLDQMADDGQAQPQAGVAASGRGVGLSEAFEDMRQEFEWNALAGVADFDFDVRRGPGSAGFARVPPWG